jgi:hypothetical protein
MFLPRSYFSVIRSRHDLAIWRRSSGSPIRRPIFFSPLNPLIQPSLIFPVPCEFISSNLPLCAAIRPSDDKFAGAVAAIASFTADGLFIGRSSEFLSLLNQLAVAADQASRQL